MLRLLRAEQRTGQCAICFEEHPDLSFLCCGIALHAACAEQWLGRAPRTCPQCRRAIPRGAGGAARRGFFRRGYDWAYDAYHGPFGDLFVAVGSFVIMAAASSMLARSLLSSLADFLEAISRQQLLSTAPQKSLLQQYDEQFTAMAGNAIRSVGRVIQRGINQAFEQALRVRAQMPPPTFDTPFASWTAIHMLSYSSV